MKLVRELLNYERTINELECLIFTANSTIDRRGNLVMGAGNALACKDAFPFVSNELGDQIEHLSEFNLHEVHVDRGTVMAFQTKINWKHKTPLYLLKNSIAALKEKAETECDRVFHLPCPGVNNGGMSVEKVMPLLECLPDNVIVYLAE
ncbi:hypothetical protein vBVpaS1601_68 [Vibrio phage vB_VpaS_1601]|uniref:phosphatase n=1 Tax=Vibrio phage SHOU24 TaxID=1414739 RepID=UPI0003ED23AC|nr:phosphatase [Vibrio phage SHOU24]AHI61210.1 hypothetical protein SHOU24_13 [Vibrio phage SHOU24]WHM52761.1 hypothetical protein vBVpaP1601_68 [Vibrio phage vB_VpaP_1601]